MEDQLHQHNIDPVDLRPVELVNDVANAVLQYHAQGMDAMEECAVSSLPLNQDELQSLLQGTAQLHQSLLAKLELQLQNFEQYAWETCLHIPAGLMPAEAQPDEEEEQFDEHTEELLDSELQSLRDQIVQMRNKQRQTSQEIATLDQELAVCDSAAQLAAIAAISEPEKENVAIGASAMVSDALRLQPLLARAEALKTEKKWQSSTTAQSQDAALLAEKAIIKQETLFNHAPMRDLQQWSEVLQGVNI